MPARILVVDDVELNRRLLEAQLSVDYYEVITAGDGEEALRLASQERPDIVLLDVMMPEIDGFEVCRRMKSDPATAFIPVVMVTALSDREHKVTGLEAGADDFLTKPVDDWALRSRVRSLLRLKMAMDELHLRRDSSAQLGVVDRIITEEELASARILALIDDQLGAGRVREVLTREGYEMTILPPARESLVKAANQHFDVALVDLGPAEEDPLRLCAQIRATEETRALPILVTVGDDERDRLEKGIDIGINDYLTKPIDPSELIARVRTQVRRKRYQDRLRADYQHGLVAALKDPLTGVYNRRYLDVHLKAELETLTRSGKPISVVMLDIDHFKAINDTHGHGAGDAVLCGLVRRVAGLLRGFDTIARYGGEEFVVVLTDMELQKAAQVAERVRIAVAADPIDLPDLRIPLSVSIGVAEGAPGQDAADLLGRADAALYQAKELGRNRVVAGTGTAEIAATSASLL